MGTKALSEYTTKKLIKSDFSKICRTCLSFVNNKISLETEGIINMFQACTNLQINESDDLPNFICISCYNKINEFYSFKLKCEHYDRVLRNIQNEKEKNETVYIKIENASDEKTYLYETPDLLNDFIENKIETDIVVQDIIKDNENSSEEIKTHEPIKKIEKVLIKTESPVSVQDPTECNTIKNDQSDSDSDDVPLKSMQTEEISVEDSYNSYIERKKRKEVKQRKREKYLTPDKCDVNTLTCKICNKTLTTIHVLLRHIERHDADRVFQCYCSICKKGFYETGQLTKHMRRHKGETRYNCKECDKPFYELAALAVHARKTHQTQPTKCTLCDKEFILKLQLEIHMETHRFRQTHTCEQCGNTFSNYWKLKSHLLKHTNEKLYTCHVCSESFKRASVLKNHQVKYHTEEKRNIYINCTECGKQITAENIKSHMIRRHSTEKLFQCNLCEKSYATEQLLDQHRKARHEGRYQQKIKTYLCPKCGKQLKSASLFYTHQHVHSGEKPFKCKYCSNKYRYKSGLRMHMKIHTGERPHECKICQKRFRESQTLKKHIYIHTGERPYACHICDKSFNQHSTLRTHMKIHGRALT